MFTVTIVTYLSINLEDNILLLLLFFLMFFDNVTCTAAFVFPFLDKSFSHRSQIGKENMF